MDNYLIRTESVLNGLKSIFPEVNFYVCNYKRTKKSYIVTKSYLDFSIEFTNKSTTFIKDNRIPVLNDSNIYDIVSKVHEDFYNQCDKLPYFNKGLLWFENLKKDYPEYEFTIKKFPYMYEFYLPYIELSIVFRKDGIYVKYHNDISKQYHNNCLYRIRRYIVLCNIINECIDLRLEYDKQIVDNR